MYLSKLIPSLLFLLAFSACEHEPKVPTFDIQLLTGRWELTNAWRNNKKTETLIGTYYEFESKGIMRTNLSLDMQEDEYEYEFDGINITQIGELETVYHIDSLTNSTLIFSTTFSDFPFKLELSKKRDSEEEVGSEL